VPPISFPGRTAIAVAVAALLVGGGASLAVLETSSVDSSPQPHATSAPSHPRTDVRDFKPWTAAGTPVTSWTVVPTQGDARCWEGSLLSARSDAYRCSTELSYDGGNLFDPCFASPSDVHKLLCPSEPFSERHLLALTSRTPGPTNAPVTGDSGPWEVELAGGVTCRITSGATDVVDGVRANFACADHRWLWGEPDKSKPQWTIRSSDSLQTHAFEPVTIVAVWY
jgi:hypothetical protein